MSPERPHNRIKTAFSARLMHMPAIGHEGGYAEGKMARFAMISVLALCMVFGTMQIASAEMSGGQIVMASLSTATPNDQSVQLPKLFGVEEQRYSDLSAFTKWTGALDNFKKEFPKAGDQVHVRDWMKFIASVKDKSKAEQIQAVNQYMNEVPFVSDEKNYGSADYWATPMEFLARGGDCEDYALAKYLSLRALGFAKEDMRLAIVYDHEMRMPHAVLVVYHDNAAQILDNQSKEVQESDELVERYKPIYSISQIAWWRH